MQLSANGLLRGAFYVLLAVSFGLIFSSTRTFHFAHGATFSLAGYLFYTLHQTLGWPIGVALAIVCGVGALYGIALEMLLYRPLRLGRAPAFVIMIASLSAFFITEVFLAAVYGDGLLRVSHSFSTNFVGTGEFRFPLLRLVIAGTSLAALVLLFLWLTSTRAGVKVRALASDPELADALGMVSQTTRYWVFAVGSVMVSVAGAFYATDLGLVPHMGIVALLYGSVAAMLGGIGSIAGGVAGAMILGVSMDVGMYFISGQWQDALAFGILILVMLFRPSGLFARRTEAMEV